MATLELTDSGLMIAIIAAGASLVVAIVGLIASLLSNRQAMASGRELERFKHQLERSSMRESAVDRNLNNSLESIALAVQAIQGAKNAIQLIVSSASDTSLDVASAVKEIAKARQQLFDAHQEKMVFLNGREEKALHRAKNLGHSAEQLVFTELRGAADLSALSSGARQRLQDIRMELTDAQELLRDSRSERLSKRIAMI